MGFKSIVEEKNLKGKRPSRHVSIEVLEVRVVHDCLEMWLPRKTLREHFGKGRFSGSDVSCDRDENLLWNQNSPPFLSVIERRLPSRQDTDKNPVAPIN